MTESGASREAQVKPAADGTIEVSDDTVAGFLVNPSVWTNKFYASVMVGGVAKITFCEASGEIERPRATVVMLLQDLFELRKLISRIEEVVALEGKDE